MDITDEKPDSGEESAPADKRMRKLPHNFLDTIWKWFFFACFKEFIKFVFPALYKAMDKRRKPEVVIGKVLPSGQPTDKGSRIADVVGTVLLREGEGPPVIVLVEQQGYSDKSFPLRVFQSVVNLQASRPDHDVIALGIFTGKFKIKGSYSKSRCGTTHTVEFETIHVPTRNIKTLREDPRLFARILHAAQVSKTKFVGEAERNALEVLRDMDQYPYNQKQRNIIIQFVQKIFNFDENKDRLTLEFIKEFYMGYVKSVKEFDLAYERENGIRIGRNKTLEEVVLRLIHHGQPVETIIMATELTKKEILAIAKEMENP
jgi:hypothetical protein